MNEMAIIERAAVRPVMFYILIKGHTREMIRLFLKDQKDRPQFHRITSKIPSEQCIHCHNRGGRTGVSYIGTMESAGYGSPWGDEGGKKGGQQIAWEIL